MTTRRGIERRFRRLLAATRGLLVALPLSLVLAGSARAQTPTGVVRGTVVDDVGRPVAGALVQLEGAGAFQVARTGERGEFRFVRIAAGTRVLSAAAVGFGSERLRIAVSDSSTMVTVPLRTLAVPMPALPRSDPRTGVVGMLVSREGLRPLAGATVTIFETGARASTEEHGLFFMQGMAPRPMLVLVSHPGYVTTFQAVTPVADTLQRMLVVLDPVSADPSGAVRASVEEFLQRVSRKSTRSLLLPHDPLFDEYHGVPVRWALERALRRPPLAQRLIFPIDVMRACILAFDAVPAATPVALDEIDAPDIEAVEIYDPRSDAGHRLRLRMSQQDADRCVRYGGGFPAGGQGVPRLGMNNYYAYSPQRGVSSGPLLIIWMKSPDRWSW